jgi:phosphate uptake regulator
METRKVQLSGGTTYTISLPKAWAREHGIDAGSVLRLHPESDGTLLVEAAAGATGVEREARIDVATRNVEAVRETVHALYTLGHDTFSLVDKTGHPDERVKAVTQLVGGLSGLELLERTDTELTLKNLIDADNVSIRKSVIRQHLIVLAMHRDAVEAVLSGDDSLAREVVDRDDEADKLFAVVTRYFRRSLTNLQEVEKLGESRDDMFEYYYVARQFERIADHAEKIARLETSGDGVDLGDDVELGALADRSRTIVEHAADVVLSDADIDVAYDALEECDTLVDDIDERIRDHYENDRHGAHTAGLLLDSLKRTAEYGANIAEMAVQRSARCGDIDYVR